MTLYKQVSGERVPLTEAEITQLNLSWETERKRQLTEELVEREKCHSGDLYQLLELLWQAISEGKIPGRETVFYKCIEDAKRKAESEILEETGLTKEEFDAARQQIEKSKIEGGEL